MRDAIFCSGYDFSRTQSIDLVCEDPITLSELILKLKTLEESGFGNFLIELGNDGTFLHKISHVKYDKIVRLV